MEQLDRVIEEIRKLMSESAKESISKRKLDEKKLAQAVGKMQEQEQRSRGAERQLQEKIWDPSGFHPRWRAPEKELILFSTLQYDARESLHLKNEPANQYAWCTFKEGEAPPSLFFLENPRHDPSIN
jgi:hypothetical protein